MGVHRSVGMDLRVAEPQFEPPPCFAGAERRAAARAAALWHAARTPGTVPDAGALGAMLDADDRAATVTIDLAHRTIVVAGCAIAAAFGLAPGPLADAGGFGARLDAACAAVADGVPTRIEGRFLRPDGAATLLTRAIALPVAADDGAITRAYVVAGWREGLAASALAQLRRDLAMAFVPVPTLPSTARIFGRA